MMRSALITGGAGFIGSHVADRLLADGWGVVAFDNLAVGREANVAHLLQRQDFSLVRGDIADRAALAQIVGDFNVNVVIHLAAVHYIPFCAAEPYEAIRINVLGTQAVIDAALAGQVGKIVFASTGDVYANKDSALTEDDVVDPFTVYGTTKLVSERLLRLAGASRPQLTVAVARLFNVYGPRETNPHVLPDILTQLRDGGDTVRLGNLWPKRDFVFVEDVADALVTLLQSREAFDVFNVGSGCAMTVEEAVQIIAGALRRPVHATVDPARVRAVERPCLHGDITKVTRVFGWRPSRTFHGGMTKWLIDEGVLKAGVATT